MLFFRKVISYFLCGVLYFQSVVAIASPTTTDEDLNKKLQEISQYINRFKNLEDLFANIETNDPTNSAAIGVMNRELKISPSTQRAPLPKVVASGNEIRFGADMVVQFWRTESGFKIRHERREVSIEINSPIQDKIAKIKELFASGDRPSLNKAEIFSYFLERNAVAMDTKTVLVGAISILIGCTIAPMIYLGRPPTPVTSGICVVLAVAGVGQAKAAESKKRFSEAIKGKGDLKSAEEALRNAQ